MEQVITILLSIVGSSAVFGFIQFMIQRKDTKDEKLKEISEKLDTLENGQKTLAVKIDEQDQSLREKMDEQDAELRKKLDEQDRDLKEALDKRDAINCRIHILAAADELRHSTSKHSKEWFDQLNDDITKYELYCDTHKDFKNNKAVHAIAAINKIYAKALEDNDFLV